MKTLRLRPQAATPALMARLERRGLILRLAPGAHALAPPPGKSAGRLVYAGEQAWGPHKLIAVTANNTELRGLGTHPDNEEFLLIGDAKARPLVLVVALHQKEELGRRVAQGRLRASDFVALVLRPNDPLTSFFVMLKGTPHGEATVPGRAQPPSFYVTEGRDLPTERVDFGDYALAWSR
ncbi:MAG TPA: hypothetical protein VNZ54_00580 [bacterium]|jgi:hypothetical protein|nr:hypothetical protein [bacterium]